MTPIAEVESKLRAAIAVVTAAGWKLKRNITLDLSRRCLCPLGAYAVAHQIQFGDTEYSAFDPIARHLGIATNGPGSIIWGFDAKKVSLSPNVHPLYALGARLAAEFCEAP